MSKSTSTFRNQTSFCAFKGEALVAAGTLSRVLAEVKRQVDNGEQELILIFDDSTGRQIDFDLRGSLEEVLERASPLLIEEQEQPKRGGPGRPKLGVVSREISLLPRHWRWLEVQRGGASASLRRLVDEAIKNEPAEQRAERATVAAGNFMTAIGGNLPNFEEAYRSLYRRERERFEAMVKEWPHDVRKHAVDLAAPAFTDQD